MSVRNGRVGSKMVLDSKKNLPKVCQCEESEDLNSSSLSKKLTIKRLEETEQRSLTYKLKTKISDSRREVKLQ